MDKCDKPLFSKTLNRSVKCYREMNHDGRCTPDYTNAHIGCGIIIGTGKPKVRNEHSTNTWIFRHDDGSEREIETGHLAKSFRGTVSFGGYSFDKNTGQNTKEWKTVYSHYNWTFNSKNPAYSFYKDMPFYDDWNPDKGGALWKGAKWIIDNLGKRPGPQWSMDVIKHELGFVPGNLRWALKNQQKFNQQHRTLGQFTDEEFLVEARKRGFILVREAAA